MKTYIKIETFNKLSREFIDWNIVWSLQEWTMKTFEEVHKELLREVRSITTPALSVWLDFWKKKIEYIDIDTVQKVFEKYAFMNWQLFNIKHDLMLLLNTIISKQERFKV